MRVSVLLLVLVLAPVFAVDTVPDPGSRKRIVIGMIFLLLVFDFIIYITGFAVDEKDDETRIALEKGISSIRLPATDVVSVPVLLGSNASECDVCQKILNNREIRIDVLIDTTEGPEFGFMRSFTRRSGIPTISTATGLSGSQRSFPDLIGNEIEWLIQINSPGDTISTVVSDLVTEYGIRNAVLFYDKSFGETYFL